MLSSDLDWVEEADIDEIVDTFSVDEFRSESLYDFMEGFFYWLCENFNYDVLIAVDEDTGILLNYKAIKNCNPYIEEY